jgi:CheY-like chemotaxis protein
MSAYRVLVIEDNLDNMTLIVDFLTSLDYTAIQARDGQVGLERAQSEKPDLILMDLSLPKMDGWTVAREIKSTPELKDIPIIAVTAHAMVGDRERALEAGCDDYITKPLSMPELMRKLNQYLEP